MKSEAAGNCGVICILKVTLKFLNQSSMFRNNLKIAQKQVSKCFYKYLENERNMLKISDFCLIWLKNCSLV